MSGSKLLLAVAAILFVIAGVLVLVHAAGELVEPLALFGFAAWAGSGAVG